MDSFGRIAEIIVTVVLLFLVPIQYMAIKQDSASQTYVATETSYLVDAVRNLGYLNKEMYSTYLKKLAATNNAYHIEITHYEYKLEELEDSYAGHYYCTYQDEILEQIFNSEEKGRYEFSQGDYLVLKVQNKSKTYGGKIQEMFLGRELPMDQIRVVYGGAIRDEV